jgi:dolichol-phosphate mannosyltransferase
MTALTPLKEPVFLSVVLYAHNNADIIESTLQKLHDFCISRFKNHEIIVVNDFSTDATVDNIQNFSESQEKSTITLITLKHKHGIETAMPVGVDFSIGDFVIEIDSAHINYDMDLLHKLYVTSSKGYDVVSLVPKRKQKVTSKLFYFLFHRLSDLKIDLDSETACILTRRAINKISLVKDKTRYRKILYKLMGYKYASVFFQPEQSLPNTSSFAEKRRMAVDILFSFTPIGMKINIFLSLAFLLFSSFLGCYALYMYITYDKVMEGWTTLMLFLSFGFSGIFLVLSILSKYFELTLKEIRTLPNQTIESINKL